MIVIKGKTYDDIDEVLTYFNPTITQITNIFLGNSPEKDDCRQELRLKVWALFKNKERIFNSAYISNRLRFDTINFINRNTGYSWFNTFKSLDTMKESEKDLIFNKAYGSKQDSLEDTLELQDIIEKSREHLTHKQYESLTIFLSGASTDMIREFLGTRSRNMTRYYLSLAEAFAIIREVAHEETELKRIPII